MAIFLRRPRDPDSLPVRPEGEDPPSGRVQPPVQSAFKPVVVKAVEPQASLDVEALAADEWGGADSNSENLPVGAILSGGGWLPAQASMDMDALAPLATGDSDDDATGLCVCDSV